MVSLRIRLRQTRKSAERLDSYARTMSTYNDPQNTRSDGTAARLRSRFLLRMTRRVGWPAGVAPTWEACLPDSAIRSAFFTSPVPVALGGLNAWVGRTAGTYLAVSSRPCFRVCAASLFSEDLLQRGYCGDRVVPVHLARHPGAITRQVAQVLGIPERRVAANLDRLTDDGLLAVASDSTPGALRSYLLRPAGGEAKKTPRT